MTAVLFLSIAFFQKQDMSVRCRCRIFGSGVKVKSMRIVQDQWIEEEVTLERRNSLFYVDAWRAHWCPYYNERVDYLFPRINEVLHLARSRGFPVLHLHWTAHESGNESQIRLQSKNLIKTAQRIVTKTIKFVKQEDTNWELGFDDNCTYTAFHWRSKTRDTRPNPQISVADTDYIGFDFKSVANIASALNITQIVFLGIHTNMCIRWVSMYSSVLGIKSVFVRGLLDSAYLYQRQREKGITDHSTMNKVVYTWFAKTYGRFVESYDLLWSLMDAPRKIYEVKWVLNPERAEPFARFYACDICREV
jgi:nicotinamidase-related amidase